MKSIAWCFFFQGIAVQLMGTTVATWRPTENFHYEMPLYIALNQTKISDVLSRVNQQENPYETVVQKVEGDTLYYEYKNSEVSGMDFTYKVEITQNPYESLRKGRHKPHQ